MAQIGLSGTIDVLSWDGPEDITGFDQAGPYVVNTFGVEGTHVEPATGQIFPRGRE